MWVPVRAVVYQEQQSVAGKALTDEDAVKFQAALKRLKITHPLSHASYLD